jgi:hypothetical protein
MTLAERWKAEGEARGEAKGLSQGRLEGQRALLQRQLRLKFGELSPQIIAKLEVATESDFALWTERVLSVDSLEGVFGDF